MSFVIRNVTLSDRDAIVAVFLDCWKNSYAAVLPVGLIEVMSHERATALWDQAITEAKSGEILVAESDDEQASSILGVTRFTIDPTEGGIVHSLYVAPRAQGGGLGRRLLAAAAHALAAEGCDFATLWVFRDNSPSVSFYRRAGWLPDGGERVEDEFGEPEIRLRADLRALEISLGVPDESG
jgi:GNAT superfamily N-acetyltransferase